MRSSILMVVTLTTLAAVSSVKVQSLDADLAARSDEMMLRYSEFKSYGLKDPKRIYARLSPDRQTQFDAVLRALYLQLEDRHGAATNQRLIHFLDAVQGIWGVRPKNQQGTHQFRLSVRWKPGLAAALKNSGNMPEHVNGHVLMPVQHGGDDDPAFTAFDVRKNGVTTHRQASREPKIQVSYLNADAAVGEVDIDYDSLAILVCTCHCRPSNSDVGSIKNASHRHQDDFNVAYNFFSMPLKPSWTDSTHHCERSY